MDRLINFQYNVTTANQVIRFKEEIPGFVKKIKGISCSVVSFNIHMSKSFREIARVCVNANAFRNRLYSKPLSVELSNQSKFGFENISCDVNSALPLTGYIKDNNVSRDADPDVPAFNPYTIAITILAE